MKLSVTHTIEVNENGVYTMLTEFNHSKTNRLYTFEDLYDCICSMNYTGFARTQLEMLKRFEEEKSVKTISYTPKKSKEVEAND